MKQFLGARGVSLAGLDVAHVEQARRVVRVLFEPGLEILAGFVESSEMPVRKSHKRVGASGRIQFDQRFEDVDGLLDFSRHEIALAQRAAKIRALWSDLQTGFQQGNGVLKIILSHADTREQKNNVGIVRRELMGTD